MNAGKDDTPGGYWTSPFEKLLEPKELSALPSFASAAIEHANPEIGTPGQDKTLWPGQQGHEDTCAIRCQEFILDQFKGGDIPENTLIQQAMDHGWYTPGSGTSLHDVGKLLELNGVGVNRYDHATPYHLAAELAQGHKVIVGVDSENLWQQHPILHSIVDKLGLTGADHAVVISGIDTSDPNDVHVVISDPGTGQAAASYPLDQFVDAWKGSGFYMVATQEPAPRWLPEMAHFDYDQGHIQQVCGLPYDTFASLADHPDVWNAALQHALEEQHVGTQTGPEFNALDAFHAQTGPSEHHVADDGAWLSGHHDHLDQATLHHELQQEDLFHTPADELT